MTIDASIPLRAAVPFSLSEIMERAERVKSMRSQREYQAWQMEQAKAEAERKTKARGSLADLVLGQSPEAPGMTAPTQPLAGYAADPNPGARGIPGAQAEAMANQGAAPMAQQPNRWAEYVQLDPEGALDFRKTTNGWTKEQFDLTRDLNEGVLQILGSVHDQASYERGKNKARALYGRYGIRLDDFDLPAEYSPDAIRGMQMEAMSTKDQLATVRAERKLDWDIEDDEIDNERMDEREDSLSSDRVARREQARRAAERRDATQRRGQDITSTDRRRGQDKPRAAGKATPARPTATGPGGKKLEWNGKAWVPVK